MTLRSLVAVCCAAVALTARADEITRRTVLRVQPDKKAKAIRTLDKREEVEVLGADNHDYKPVEAEDGLRGWVLAKYVKPEAPARADAPGANGGATTISPSWSKPAPTVGEFTLDGKTCGVDGSGDTRDKGTNRRKNRTDVPSSYHLVTFEALAGLDPHRGWPKSRENFSPEQLAEIGTIEGAAVQTVGYLVAIKPQASNSESCNCGWHGDRATDWHIALVDHAGDGEASSVVVEPTPRLRKKHLKWTKSMLKDYIDTDLPVRISGWLLFDPQHANHLGKYRKSLWEIHPITKIEVWDTEKEKFVDLDDVPLDGATPDS